MRFPPKGFRVWWFDLVGFWWPQFEGWLFWRVQAFKVWRGGYVLDDCQRRVIPLALVERELVECACGACLGVRSRDCRAVSVDSHDIGCEGCGLRP